jgi:hypothetical protein
MVQTANVITLKPRTLEAFISYIRAAEEEMDASLNGHSAFLWSDRSLERVQLVRQGNVIAQLWRGDWPIKIPNGLIHDWVGAVLVPHVTIEQVLGLVQNYDNHKNIYQPEVLDSKLLEQDRNDFKIFLRLLKKKIVTVVLDTEHYVHYSAVEAKRWFCRSYSTRIAEVEDAGTPKEQILEPDTGYGFLWRLNSYWKFDERKDGSGVHIECRAISLTRDIPTGLGWIIDPIVRKLPQESLIHTLLCTRNALVLPPGMPPPGASDK